MFIYLNLFFYFSRSTSCEIKLCVVGKKDWENNIVAAAANDHIRNTNFWILSHLIRNTLDWFLNLFFFLRSFSFRICFIPQLNSQHTTLNKSLCVPYIISSCLFCSMCLCMSECVCMLTTHLDQSSVAFCLWDQRFYLYSCRFEFSDSLIYIRCVRMYVYVYEHFDVYVCVRACVFV